ncbi:MAG: hypothetical protein OXI92_18155, partial [Acidobacteriota bacterium]|nr:hypothetical protein [Acidobacteriota bacterium]
RPIMATVGWLKGIASGRSPDLPQYTALIGMLPVSDIDYNSAERSGAGFPGPRVKCLKDSDFEPKEP